MNEQSQQYGHPYFHKLTQSESQLHNAKNHDYAAGGHPLGNFLRVASILSLYPKLDTSDPTTLAMTYLLKQLDAYLWIKSNRIVTKVEGVQERLTDISVYAKLINCMEHDLALARKAAQAHQPANGQPAKPALRLITDAEEATLP